jgi:PHP family Zn ribbon phosphoesterase
MTNPRTRREIASYEWRIERAKAEEVRCPRCGAQVGEGCWNTETGEDLAAPAHWQRITDARGERS